MLKKTSQITIITIIVCIVLYVFYKFIVGDPYVSDDYDWNVILNNPEKEYGIICNDGSYWLTFSPQDEKSHTSGLIVGSSPTDLDKFCDKQVQVLAKGRDYKDKPFCTQDLMNRNPNFCNSKMPVVDILEIAASKK